MAAAAGMVTVAGTVMLPVEVKATAVAVVTGAVIVTVQAATAAGDSDAGLQVSLLSIGTVGPEVMAPPVVLVGSGLPSRVTPPPPETPTVADAAPDARVIATFATVPFAIRLLLMPLAIQM